MSERDAVELAREQVRHCDTGHEEVREAAARRGVVIAPNPEWVACGREHCILARALLKERERAERWKRIAELAQNTFGFADCVVLSTGNLLLDEFDAALAAEQEGA